MTAKQKKDEGKVPKKETAGTQFAEHLRQELGTDRLFSLNEVSSEIAANDIFTTGSIFLDEVLGGGLPRGHIVEIYGDSGTGKSTLALYMLAQATLRGEPVLFIDTECASHIPYWKQFKSNESLFCVIKPKNGNEALSYVLKALNSEYRPSIIVIDSVAGLTFSQTNERNIMDVGVAETSRILSPFWRNILSVLDETKSTLICLNQTRMKLNTGSFPSFNAPQKTTPGGTALSFFSHVMLFLSSSKSDINRDADGNPVSAKVKVKVEKNRTSTAYKTTDIVIVFGSGIDRSEEIFRLALQKNIIKQSGGGFFKLGEELIGRGSTDVIDKIRESEELKEQLIKLLGLK